jgi:cytoplasmic iron level regulating protein YaaA (DUF328/UPF0246 family)
MKSAKGGQLLGAVQDLINKRAALQKTQLAHSIMGILEEISKKSDEQFDDLKTQQDVSEFATIFFRRISHEMTEANVINVVDNFCSLKATETRKCTL